MGLYIKDKIKINVIIYYEYRADEREKENYFIYFPSVEQVQRRYIVRLLDFSHNVL